MLRILAIILLVSWLLGVGVFHAAGSLIHLLLVLAVISFLWHFIAGRKATP
jgi:Family of unknown function (DUF5670)